MSEDTPLEMWEGQAVGAWRERWQLPELHVFSVAGSTNDIIKERAEAGAPAGACAIAERQTRGRGRRESRWDAPAGTGLLISMLFRPDSYSPADLAGTIPLRVGMAVARAVRNATSLDVALKWPNDVLAPDGRKIAGILCESSLASAGLAYTVVGIGINVLQTDAQLHGDDRNRAVSLSVLHGRTLDRAALATALIAELHPLMGRPATALSSEELQEFSDRDILAHRDITADGVAVGIAEGIGPHGDLRVRAGDATRSIHAGSIRPV